MVPAYNYADRLPRAIQSVLPQLREGIDLLVINDGSTDTTEEVLSELLDTYGPVFSVITKENGGLSSARNCGITNTQSDFLLFLDADDELTTDAVDKISKHITHNPQTKMVIGGYTSVWCDLNKQRETLHTRISNSPIERLIAYLIDKKLSLANGATVMHRDIFKLGLYPEHIRNTEDIPVFAQALANFECSVLPELLLIVYKHKTSMRHDIHYSHEVGMSLVDEVFETGRLCQDARKLKTAYISARALSLSRDYYRAGCFSLSKSMYFLAIKNKPSVVFKASYTRKFIRTLFRHDRLNVHCEERWVLQIAHTYEAPFLDCARQYAVLFNNTKYKVCTVFLKGKGSDEIAKGAASDKVIFLNLSSKQIAGLKLGAIQKIKKLHKEYVFEFCIAHRPKPIYIALLATDIPVIGVHHGFGDYERKPKQLFTQRFANRLKLLGVSDAIRDEIRLHLPHFPQNKIQTLYNRIDLDALQSELLSKEEARESLDLPLDAWIIGNVGRLHPDKDQTTLIKGFANALPQLEQESYLVIMGSGRLEQRLKQLASELNVANRVIFLGQVANGRRYFKAFDLFVLTSDHEPFGMVLLEAMAADVPVIATDCGGAKEVVENPRNLFPLGDIDALADKLINRDFDSDVSRVKLFTDELVIKKAKASILGM